MLSSVKGLYLFICVAFPHKLFFFFVIIEGVSPNNTSLKAACPVHGHAGTLSAVCESVLPGSWAPSLPSHSDRAQALGGERFRG